jgi:hypothetical protein
VAPCASSDDAAGRGRENTSIIRWSESSLSTTVYSMYNIRDVGPATALVPRDVMGVDVVALSVSVRYRGSSGPYSTVQ